MNEAQFQKRLTDYCDLLGIRWHHEVDSRKSKAGFPDLVLVGARGVLFVEVKRDGGRVRPEQKEWLDALNAAGVPAIVARPDEWPMVRADLDRIAGRA